MQKVGDLAARFDRWCRLGGVTDDHERWGKVYRHYSEPIRHYHNLDHIASSLHHLDQVKPGDWFIEGAIWFHDVIYDPSSSDNETRSAAFFRRETGGWLEEKDAGVIERLILATDPRVLHDHAADASLMVDIDLAILGAPADLYEAYARAIRLEYRHVSEDAYRRGRSAVMSKFLSIPIYRTAAFADREASARANIARELAALAGG